MSVYVSVLCQSKVGDDMEYMYQQGAISNQSVSMNRMCVCVRMVCGFTGNIMLVLCLNSKGGMKMQLNRS